jgi:hypothetical protein
MSCSFISSFLLLSPVLISPHIVQEEPLDLQEPDAIQTVLHAGVFRISMCIVHAVFLPALDTAVAGNAFLGCVVHRIGHLRGQNLHFHGLKLHIQLAHFNGHIEAASFPDIHRTYQRAAASGCADIANIT